MYIQMHLPTPYFKSYSQLFSIIINKLYLKSNSCFLMPVDIIKNYTTVLQLVTTMGPFIINYYAELQPRQPLLSIFCIQNGLPKVVLCKKIIKYCKIINTILRSILINGLPCRTLAEFIKNKIKILFVLKISCNLLIHLLTVIKY